MRGMNELSQNVCPWVICQSLRGCEGQFALAGNLKSIYIIPQLHGLSINFRRVSFYSLSTSARSIRQARMQCPKVRVSVAGLVRSL